MEPRFETREAMRGGSGRVLFKHILGEKEMKGKCRMFAEITLEPGSSIGYHVHSGESETYYILSGSGAVNDNGCEKRAKAGDITFTPDGCGHSILNDGKENLVFMALIILD